ncbi:DoxX family membrane protein [Sphingobacteriales bacterium CHB3]|nr:DoxX family membrane protein [Sphingobacteriales bacterium CHB3]
MVTQAQAFKIIAILIGLFLIATGFDKIVHFSDFIRSLGNYWFVPLQWATSVGVTVILLELFLGLCLFFTSMRPLASLGAAIMLMLVTGASLLQKYFMPLSDCGCWFSVPEPKTIAIHTIINVAIIWSLFQIHRAFKSS